MGCGVGLQMLILSGKYRLGLKFLVHCCCDININTDLTLATGYLLSTITQGPPTRISKPGQLRISFRFRHSRQWSGIFRRHCCTSSIPSEGNSVSLHLLLTRWLMPHLQGNHEGLENPTNKVYLKLIYYFTYFSTVVSPNSCVFLSCRLFVVNTTFSTGLVGVEVCFVA